MEEKYYWMSFQMGDMITEQAVTEHPFIVITKLRRNSSFKALLNWKEISKDDYVLFLDILYNINKYVGEDDRPAITITLEKDDTENNQKA